jgi:hypothetical protein
VLAATFWMAVAGLALLAAVLVAAGCRLLAAVGILLAATGSFEASWAGGVAEADESS